MPRLREFQPPGLESDHDPFECSIPDWTPVDPSVQVAIFDGGCHDLPAFRRCVIRHDAPDISGEVDEYVTHGTAATSAFLYGSLSEDTSPPRPLAQVHHYRVLDQDTYANPHGELYPVLRRVLSVLESTHYDFVSMSIGPNMPLDDDDVNPWTAKLDPLIKNNAAYATLAGGNTGEADPTLGLNRIQPPSDCVNATAIGACTSENGELRRALYSSVGHGRTPGFTKPDGVAFGGDEDNPFFALGTEQKHVAHPMRGTSLATPYTMRSGVAVRVYLGSDVSSLAIRALSIHKCVKDGHDPAEVGWGRFCTDIGELLTCDDNETTVIYQGAINPRSQMRAAIPTAAADHMTGMVTLSATICYLTDTDPEHPSNYTKSGLLITFRKDKNKLTVRKEKDGTKTQGTTGQTTTFFPAPEGMTESERRQYAHVWETVRHDSQDFQARTLNDPVFDIHHNPRDNAADATDPAPIPYAMVITVRSKKDPGFYNSVRVRYPQLSPLEPVLELPIPAGPG